MSNIKEITQFLLKLLIDLIVGLGRIVLFPIKYLSANFPKSLVRIKQIKIEFPTFEVPSIKVPTIALPKITFPKIKLPKIQFKNATKQAKKTKKSKKQKSKKIILNPNLKVFLLGAVSAFLFLFIPITLVGWYNNLPRPELLSQVTNKSTKILDRKGRLLYEIYIDRNYDPVSLEQIPLHVQQATIAIEDDAFYHHLGVRPLSMLRALVATLTEGELQGGSTITQQLVKNVLLSPERTISRKIKEMVVSLMVEQRYTKDEILEMYLNNISYGGTAWGIQSASEKFFNKDAQSLTLAEASLLAGLPSAPSSFSPFGGGLDKAKIRQKQVLDRMVELGYISRLDANDAYSEELQFGPQAQYIRAPHFVNYIRDLLEEKYGTRLVNLGGLTVTTSLDLDLQDEVQKIVTDQVEKNAWLKVSNGAAVVMDSQTAEILAYVGSKDYFDALIDGNVDIATSYRQPGSTVKAITYALALDNGFTPASILKDEKITLTFPGAAPYTPVNYDGKFHGDVTLRTALANSYNIPAVLLANKLGPDKIVDQGNAMGLKNWIKDGNYGVSITLGGKEVRLLDLTNVFATLARYGVYKETQPILSVKDARGYEIYHANKSEKNALSKEAAYLATNILSDNNARTPAFGSRSYLYIPNHQVAVKTGTTDEKRDNWTVGYTPSYTVGVWVGNNDNSPMHPYLSSGLTGASPIWNEIMNVLLEDSPSEKFEIPDKIFVKVDADCNNRSEVFIKGTAPAHLCDPSKEKEENSDK
jgi:1A family penicillin-binding protein